MSGYDREQQRLDVEIMNNTISALGARTIGEKLDICEGYLGDYIRISRFWAEKRFSNPQKQMATLHMFIDLARSPKTSAFTLVAYEKLCKETKKMIQAKIFRRRQKPDTCEQPDVHKQTCFCGNMHRGVIANRVEGQ